jgi:hypothetical protein
MAFNIYDVFLQWESAGIFEFLLPALLIFALVYGILNTTSIISREKNIQIIIAIIIALIAVGYTSTMGFSLGMFLMELFPRLAVGLSIVLALLILIGLFVPGDERRFWLYGLGAISFIIAIVIVTKSFERFGWIGGGYYGDYVGWIIGAVLVVGLIIAVASSGNKPIDTRKPPYTGNVEMPPWR